MSTMLRTVMTYLRTKVTRPVRCAVVHGVKTEKYIKISPGLVIILYS